MRVHKQEPGTAARLIALFLIALLASPPSPAQSGSATEGPPTRLQIHVLTQTPFAQPAGVLSAHSLQVRITDEWGMPVRGVTVSFRLPEVGPGGSFLNGLSSEIAITNERGEAAVQGFDWREETGVTFVHVIAAYGAIRAGAMVEVHLSQKPPTSTTKVVPPALSAEPNAPSTLPSTPVPPTKRRTAPRELGQVAEGRSADTVALPSAKSPREHIPEAPPTRYEIPDLADSKASAAPADNDEQDAAPDPYIRVKSKQNGGSRLWMVLLMAGAAGGAVAAGLAVSGSGTSDGQGANPSMPPVTRIGNPTITISNAGGN